MVLWSPTGNDYELSISLQTMVTIPVKKDQLDSSPKNNAFSRNSSVNNLS